MKYVWLGCFFAGSLLFAGPQDSDTTNVNARYTVETVIVSGKGWSTNLSSETTDKISSGLRHRLTALIGQKLNPEVLDGLAQNLKKELSAREVTHRIVRGEAPEQVRVEFEVRPARASLGMNVNQFVYDAKQGWSGSGEADVTLHQHTFALGLVSDGDWLNERDAGIMRPLRRQEPVHRPLELSSSSRKASTPSGTTRPSRPPPSIPKKRRSIGPARNSSLRRPSSWPSRSPSLSALASNDLKSRVPARACRPPMR